MIGAIDVVVVLFGLSLLAVTISSRLELYLKVLSLQGVLLLVAGVASLSSHDPLGAVVVVVETLGFKTILIPWYLRRVIRENGVFRETEPRIANFSSLIVGSLLFAFGLIIAYWAGNVLRPVKPLQFGMSISAILIGLFVILRRRQLLTHIVGYIILENGIFLLSLSVAGTMPVVVELGISLDVFVGVFVFGILVSEIRHLFEQQDVDQLTGLKD